MTSIRTGSWFQDSGVQGSGAKGGALSAIDRALCEYAIKLTAAPATMSADDVDALRSLGLDDVAIHHAIQVTSYFNYINRIADAIDVELEPEYPPRPRP